MREAARRSGQKADVYLSHLGRNVRDLLEVQSFVNRVVVPEEWKHPAAGHMGNMPVEGDYEQVYQLCLHTSNIEGTLLDHFGRVLGVGRQGHFFELPLRSEEFKSDYIVLATKEEDQGMVARWGSMWRDFVRRCRYPVAEVGRPEVPCCPGTINMRSAGFLAMAVLISRARYFFGHISSPLVLADAMPDVVRVAVHDGSSWDLRACTQSPMNHYPVCFDADHLLGFIA
jgi:hypothetical protein